MLESLNKFLLRVSHQLPLAQFQAGIDLVEAGNKSVKVTLVP